MFKRKKKKTGVQTPELRKPTPPPPPPTSGSNAVKPNPNYVPPASVKKLCPYELPCGWCTKWDKKCDKKISGGDNDKPQRGLRAESVLLDDAIPMPGLQAMLRGERYDDTLKIHFEGEFTND